MKRIAVAMVLASLVAISCVVSVAATYAGDANTTWLLNESGTVGWLYVQNGGSAPILTVRLALPQAAAVDGAYTVLWDGSYEYVILPTALPAGGNVTFTISGVGGKAIGLTGVELGDFYTWLALPAGTEATVDTLVGGPVVVKSADGKLNSVFFVNPDTPSAFVRLRGSNVVVGTGYATFTDGSYVYVNLGAPTVVGGITTLPLRGGQLDRVEFGSNWWAWSEVGSVLTITNLGSPKNAAVVNVRATAGVMPTLDAAHSYVFKADGTHVVLALSPDETIRQYDFATNSAGDLIRMWLPTTIGFGEPVVLAFDFAPHVYTVSLGTQGIK